MSVTYCQMTFAPLCQLRLQTLAALSTCCFHLQDRTTLKMAIVLPKCYRPSIRQHSITSQKTTVLSRTGSACAKLRRNRAVALRDCGKVTVAIWIAGRTEPEQPVVVLHYWQTYCRNGTYTENTDRAYASHIPKTCAPPPPPKETKCDKFCAVRARVQLRITINAGLIERCSQVSRSSAT